MVVFNGAVGEQGLPIAGPRNFGGSIISRRRIRRAVSTHAFEGGSIQNIDRHSPDVTDGQPFAIRTKGYSVGGELRSAP